MTSQFCSEWLMESLGCGNGDASSARRLVTAFLLSNDGACLCAGELVPVLHARGLAPSLQVRLAVRDRASQGSAETVTNEPVVGAM